jgi:hypothetical protein
MRIISFYTEKLVEYIEFLEFIKVKWKKQNKETCVITRLINGLSNISNDYPDIKTDEVNADLFSRYRNLNKASWKVFKELQ